MKIHMEGFLEETSKSKEYISKKKKKDCTSYLKIPSLSGKEENTSVGLFIRLKFYKRQWRRRCYRDAFYERGHERWTRVSFCKYNRGSWIVAFGHTRTWRDNKDYSCDWRRSGMSGMGTFASRCMRTRPISENSHAFFRRWTRGWNLPVGNTLEQKRHKARVRRHRLHVRSIVKFSMRFDQLSRQFSMLEDKRHTFLYVWFVVEPAIDRRSSKGEGRDWTRYWCVYTRWVIKSSLEAKFF